MHYLGLSEPERSLLLSKLKKSTLLSVSGFARPFLPLSLRLPVLSMEEVSTRRTALNWLSRRTLTDSWLEAPA